MKSAKRRRKKDKTPKTRYVYLMERNASIFKRIFFRNRDIKIGVATDPDGREKRVDRDISGKIRIIDRYLVRRATTVESLLHRKYNDRRFVPKGKKGSGKTEFFKLSRKDIKAVRKILKDQEVRNDLWWWVVAAILFFLVVFYHQIKN